jgi:hypothetical protein
MDDPARSAARFAGAPAPASPDASRAPCRHPAASGPDAPGSIQTSSQRPPHDPFYDNAQRQAR